MYMVGGTGALRRSDSINVTTPSAPSKSQMDEMMDAADSMSLDDKELAVAAQEAKVIMEENMSKGVH